MSLDFISWSRSFPTVMKRRMIKSRKKIDEYRQISRYTFFHHIHFYVCPNTIHIFKSLENIIYALNMHKCIYFFQSLMGNKVSNALSIHYTVIRAIKINHLSKIFHFGGTTVNVMVQYMHRIYRYNDHQLIKANFTSSKPRMLGCTQILKSKIY